MAEAKVKETSKKPAVEEILSKEEKTSADKKPAAKSDKPKKKTRHKHTHIEHHYDASGKPTGHTVRHTPEGGGPEQSYVANDLNGVKAGLDQNLGEAAAPEAAGPEPAGAPEPAPAVAAPQPAPQGA